MLLLYALILLFVILVISSICCYFVKVVKFGIMVLQFFAKLLGKFFLEFLGISLKINLKLVSSFNLL